MNETARNKMIELTKDLIMSKTCCEELKDAANAWLNSFLTAKEQEETEHYFQVLKESILTVDDLIEFGSSEQGKQRFGTEVATNIVEHGKELKKTGATYCDCPACSLVEQILSLK